MSSLYALGQTCTQMWNSRVAVSGARPFLHCTRRSWTYAEADAEIRRIAYRLSRLGIGESTRVLVGMTNRPETLFVHFAIGRLAGIIVGLVPGSSYDELAYVVRHSEAEFLIADDPVASLLLARAPEHKNLHTVILANEIADNWAGCLALDSGAGELLEGEAAPAALDDLRPSHILYTSGSTAKPKGVLIPAGAFVSSGAGYARRCRMTEADHFLLPFTMAHAVGALLGPSIAVWCGGQLTLLERFSPSDFLDKVRESGATATLLFPAQINLVLAQTSDAAEERPLPLRVVMTHEWIESIWRRFRVPLALTWGSTESGATGAGSGSDYRGEGAAGYIGPPYGEEEIEAFDAKGQILPRGSTGELCMKHRHIMIGYLNEPETTASTIVDGWLRTGDLGSVDELGHVYFAGRVKNMIKRSGENISPEEIEFVLQDHPSVKESVVFGVPDPVRTQEVAIVVRVEERFACDPDELHQFLSSRLSRWKIPRFFRIVSSDLPRLGVGKFDRVAIAQSFALERFWDARASRGARKAEAQR